MNIQSSFIDHTFLDKTTLGNLYQNFDYFPFVKASTNSSVFVNTCHRVEFYYFENNPISFNIGNATSKSTNETRETAIRLTHTMTGLNSVVLGETFISDQVFTYLGQENELHYFFNKCLNISNLARKKFNFYNYIDYNTIALSLLPNADNLTLIGGGMLIKNLLPRTSDYKNITVITRNPKKFKKSINIDKKINVLKLDNYTIQQNTNCIIATTLDENYKSKIQKMMNTLLFSKIVDLSSIPLYELRSNKTNYVHMNDKAFLKKIKIGNSNFYKRVPEIKNFINTHLILGQI